jgi:hypothetical protein
MRPTAEPDVPSPCGTSTQALTSWLYFESNHLASMADWFLDR